MKHRKNVAARLYSAYLARFGNRPEAYEMYYNLAEIHFYRLENAGPAADAYLAAVRLNPGGALSRTALYNALAALEVARAAEFEAAKKAGKKPEETPTDKKLTEAMVMGTPVIALCGKVWVPSRDPEKFPVCPECKEIWESMTPGDEGEE